MTGRRLRTRLDLIKPKSKDYQLKQKRQDRCFEIGQAVWIRDYRSSSSKWIPGVIENRIGQVMYSVQVTINDMPVTWNRHADQLMSRESNEHGTLQHGSTQEESSSRSSPTETTSPELIPLMMKRSTLVSLDSDDIAEVPSSSTATVPMESTELQTSNRPTETATVMDKQTVTKHTTRGRTVNMPVKFKDFITN